ncbi:unnamed protein product [Toxocara canis]|uniref:Ovule protein n=1 Tax=Toxocara canis TaxID=6265 RepID=A0A183V8Y6_TOXCA|nr:unnamed protein product [Toxocara canis]
MLGARLEDNMLDAIGNSASVGNVENELNVEESGHSELDYEKSTRRESDHQAKRVLEQEPSPEAVGEHNCASQKAVKATETSAVFASEEVGTNSHEVRSSRSDIKFMVSGLSENSEAVS